MIDNNDTSIHYVTKSAHCSVYVNICPENCHSYDPLHSTLHAYMQLQVYLAKQRVKSSNQSNPIPPGFCSFVLANPLISAHHLVIALVFAPMMTVLFRSHEPGMLMLGAAFVLESSTPFVTLRSVMADLGLKNTAAYVANGLTLIAVFFACRIAVYPIFFKVHTNSIVQLSCFLQRL